jgi:hypothetical protein
MRCGVTDRVWIGARDLTLLAVACLQPDDVFLNLVMEYIPETIHRTLRNHTKAKKLVPIMYTKGLCAELALALRAEAGVLTCIWCGGGGV